MVPAEWPVVQPLPRSCGCPAALGRRQCVRLRRVPLSGADRVSRGTSRGRRRRHLVRIFHRDVLVAEHVQRRKPTPASRRKSGCRAARPRQPTDGMVVTRVVDSSGYVSFAYDQLPSRQPLECCAYLRAWSKSVIELSIDGQIVRVHPIRHDRAKEHGVCYPERLPRHRQDAPAWVGVTLLRGRPTGRALTPTLTRRSNAAARNHPTPKNQC